MTSAKPHAVDRRAANERTQRLQNLRGFLLGLGIAISLTVALWSVLFTDQLGTLSPYVLTASATLAGACTAYIVSLYLNGKLNFGTTVTFTSSSSPNISEDIALGEFRERLGALITQLSAVQEETQRAEVGLLHQCRAVFAESRNRLLKNEIQVDRRSRVSLVAGSAITTVAVVTLLAFAFPPIALVPPTWQQLLSTYLPKVGVIVMLEVFAFFFLGLYKASLKESRALHDALSLLAFKEAALVAAWTESDSQRLQVARIVAHPQPIDSNGREESVESVDPKALADLVAAIAKLVRG